MTVRDVGVWRSQDEPVVEAFQDHASVDSSCIRHASEVVR